MSSCICMKTNVTKIHKAIIHNASYSLLESSFSVTYPGSSSVLILFNEHML